MSNHPPFRFKRRNYLHFDLPVSHQCAEELACDSGRVARHSFYPFLGFTNVIRRVKEDENGLMVVKKKHREIKIASHRDAAIYSRYSDLLSVAYETELTNLEIGHVVSAFRQLPSGGTNIDFAGAVFDYINRHRPCVALAFDLEKFFDTLDHDLLKSQWLRLLAVQRLPPDHFAVFKSLTEFSWVEREEAFKALGISRHNPKANGRRRICEPDKFRREIRAHKLIRGNPTPGEGIPQGSPISALLSNIYMLDFDAELNTQIQGLGGLYRRYCDDIMIVVPPEHQLAAEAFVRGAVQTVGLTFNISKTDRALFPEGNGQPIQSDQLPSGFSAHIQYLGFTFNGAQRLIRPGSLVRYYGKMRAGVSLAKQTRRRHNRIETARGDAPSPLRTRKLSQQYSYLIDRRSCIKGRDKEARGNFLTYAYKASRKLGAPEIKRQVRNHWKKLQDEINEAH